MRALSLSAVARAAANALTLTRTSSSDASVALVSDLRALLTPLLTIGTRVLADYVVFHRVRSFRVPRKSLLFIAC